jgi:hypothetical protein
VSAGSGEWFGINAAQVCKVSILNTFVCYANGSFSNVQELILGLRNGKVLMLTAVAVAPMTGHSSYISLMGSKNYTINGKVLGIPKANNAGELPKVAVPTSIIFNRWT